jgi:hypothetical protein
MTVSLDFALPETLEIESSEIGAFPMKNLSTGTGLALLAGAIVAFPLVNRVSSMDQAAHALPPVEAARPLRSRRRRRVRQRQRLSGTARLSQTGFRRSFVPGLTVEPKPDVEP